MRCRFSGRADDNKYHLFFRCIAKLSAPALGFLQDHAVRGRPLFPAAAYMEAGAAAAGQLLGDESSKAGCLQGLAFLAPLLLSIGINKGRGNGYALPIHCAKTCVGASEIMSAPAYWLTLSRYRFGTAVGKSL